MFNSFAEPALKYIHEKRRNENTRDRSPPELLSSVKILSVKVYAVAPVRVRV